jgi:hypothetical protein
VAITEANRKQTEQLFTYIWESKRLPQQDNVTVEHMACCDADQFNSRLQHTIAPVLLTFHGQTQPNKSQQGGLRLL